MMKYLFDKNKSRWIGRCEHVMDWLDYIMALNINAECTISRSHCNPPDDYPFVVVSRLTPSFDYARLNDLPYWGYDHEFVTMSDLEKLNDQGESIGL